MKSNNNKSGISLLVKHQQEFAYDVAILITYADHIGVKLTIGEAYRPIDQQLLYYYGLKLKPVDNGLALIKSKRLTKTLLSNHMKRLAIDFNFFIDGNLTYNHPKIIDLGEYWESLNMNNRWGGNFKKFKDTPHFERHLS